MTEDETIDRELALGRELDELLVRRCAELELGEGAAVHSLLVAWADRTLESVGVDTDRHPRGVPSVPGSSHAIALLDDVALALAKLDGMLGALVAFRRGRR
jgi:hypothetical protein